MSKITVKCVLCGAKVTYSRVPVEQPMCPTPTCGGPMIPMSAHA